MEILKSFELTKLDEYTIDSYSGVVNGYYPILENCIRFNGYLPMLSKFIEISKLLLEDIYRLTKKNHFSIMGQNIVLQVLIGNMLSSLENFYFARNILKDRMLEYYNEFKEFINDTQKKLKNKIKNILIRVRMNL